LRLHKPSNPGDAPHLQAEVYRERYEEIRKWPLPWRVKLPQEKLFTVPD
jgi:hypothetical protein